MNIYIIVESPKRELDARIFLAMKLLKFGFRPHIVKKSRLFEKLNLIEPGILFFKSFGPKYEKFIKNIKKYNHEITGIDEEGLQLYSDASLIGEKRFSKKTIFNSKVLFSWGDFTKSIYKKTVDKKIKIISSGNPRIDLIKNTKKIYHEDSKKLKKKYGKFILIPTQFLKGNNASGVKMSSLVKLPRTSKLSNIEKIRYKKNFIYQLKSLKKFEVLYNFLSKNFSNKKFIIRPHPSENLKYYQNFDKKYKNIKVVIDNQPINPWILASDFVISNNCTTAIEAFFIKGNSINYLPYKDLSQEYNLNKMLSIESRSLKHLSKLLKNDNLNKIKIDKKKLKKLKSIIHNYDQTNSYDVIGRTLSKIYKNRFNSKEKEKEGFLTLKFFFYFLKTKIFEIRNFLFYRNRPEYLTEKSKSGFTKKQIEQKINNLSKIDSFLKKCKVEQKYYGIFSIKKN